MQRNSFKKANCKMYSTVLWQSDFLAWGNAKGKNKIKKSLRRYGRRKLNQILT